MQAERKKQINKKSAHGFEKNETYCICKNKTKNKTIIILLVLTLPLGCAGEQIVGERAKLSGPFS